MHTYRQECFVTAFCKVLGYGTQRHLGCKNQAAEWIVLRAGLPPVLLNFLLFIYFLKSIILGQLFANDLNPKSESVKAENTEG